VTSCSKVSKNHQAAQAFPKCQKISSIRIFPKVTKTFWAEMKKETFNLYNFPWQTKISKKLPENSKLFFLGEHSWKFFLPILFEHQGSWSCQIFDLMLGFRV
jgi:hypothetical protein